MARRGESRRRRKQNLRAWQAQHGEDRSEIVYTYADGWTVRNILRLLDATREGFLMQHCLCRGMWERHLYGDDPHEPILTVPTTPKDYLAERLCADDWYLMSLRDPSNHPHVTFGVDLSFGPPVVDEPQSLGRRHGMDPKYLSRIEEFEGAPIQPTEPEELIAEINV